LPLLPFFTIRKPAVPAGPRKPYTLNASGISIQVHRKPVKILRMTLRSSDQFLHISAPLRISDQTILRFVASKLTWVELQRRRLAQQQPCAPLQYVDGERLPLFGRDLVLKISIQGKRATAKSDGPHALILTIPNGATQAQKRNAVQKWYKRQLLSAAQDLLADRQTAMGVLAHALKIRSMHSRWGSCNIRTKTITLALGLALRPPAGLEYVLVHELAHLRVRGHTKEFKSILDSHLPDWRLRRKNLNAHPLNRWPL